MLCENLWWCVKIYLNLGEIYEILCDTVWKFSEDWVKFCDNVLKFRETWMKFCKVHCVLLCESLAKFGWSFVKFKLWLCDVAINIALWCVKV